MTELNLLFGKAGEIPMKTYLQHTSSNKKTTWSDRDANSWHQRWEASGSACIIQNQIEIIADFLEL